MVCVVPARMASSRFPGKPLIDIAGLPLVIRSALRGRQAGCFERIVVASEDREIVSVAQEHGFESILTPSFETGTDRVAWAGGVLGARWLLNLQGDEPLFPVELLRELARRVPEDDDALWTAADLAFSEKDLRDDDVVKIVLGEGDEAERAGLDFYRALPPREEIVVPLAVHVGVYAGSMQMLKRFSELPETPLERLRRIEPLRALEHGMRVRAILGRWNRVAVDRMEHISMVLDVLKTRGE